MKRFVLVCAILCLSTLAYAGIFDDVTKEISATKKIVQDIDKTSDAPMVSTQHHHSGIATNYGQESTEDFIQRKRQEEIQRKQEQDQLHAQMVQRQELSRQEWAQKQAQRDADRQQAINQREQQREEARQRTAQEQAQAEKQLREQQEKDAPRIAKAQAEQARQQAWGIFFGIIATILGIPLVILSLYGVRCPWSQRAVYFNGWKDMWVNFGVGLIAMGFWAGVWMPTNDVPIIGIIIAKLFCILGLTGYIYYIKYAMKQNKHITNKFVYYSVFVSRMTIGLCIPWLLVCSIFGSLARPSSNDRNQNYNPMLAIAWFIAVGYFCNSLIKKSQENYELYSGNYESGKTNSDYQEDTTRSSSFNSQEDVSQSVESPYEILGVSPNATMDEVKDAYRKKILQYHPDRTGGLGEKLRVLAEQEAKKINNAYDEIRKSRNGK